MGKNLLVDLFERVSKNITLQENNVVKLLIKHCTEIDFSTRENCFESILEKYKNIDNFNNFNFSENTFYENPSSNQSNHNLDFRVCKVELGYIKCFSVASDGLPYGISFKDDTESPCSVVIYGTNGVGKSAFFGAMEYVYCNRVTEYSLRNSGNNNDWLSFLAHNGNSKAAFCNLSTPSKKLNFNQDPSFKKLSHYSNSCFINETTVAQNGRVDFSSDNDISAHKLIASGLGLEELITASQTLLKISTYNRQKEKKEYVAANLAVTNSRNLLDSWNNRNLEIVAQIDTLKRSEALYVIDSEQSRVAQLVEIIKSERLTFYSDAGELEGVMRDFLMAYQKWSEVENFTIIEHRYEMMLHARHLVDKSWVDNICPLCKAGIDIENFGEAIDMQVRQYRLQLELKDTAYKAMDDLFEKLDEIIDKTENFISSINDKILLLGNYSIFGEIVATMRQLVTVAVQSRDNDFICELVAINKSGEKMAQLHRFLYFELERLIGVCNGNYDRIQSIINTLYSKIDNLAPDNQMINRVETSKQIGILERELDFITSQSKKERLHLDNLNTIAAQTKAKYDLQLSVINQIKEIAPKAVELVNKDVVKMFLPIRELITEVMSDFLADDNVQLDMNCENNFVALSIVTKDGSRVSPAMYFNAFRYKLFCTALSLSVILGVRKSIGINMPIVFDDPFLGFDTNDRQRMVMFARKMANIIGRYGSSKHPIQVISFTHNWQLFQILRAALQSAPNTKFLILDSLNQAHKNGSYYELTRKA